MRNDMEYNLFVQQPVEQVMNQVAQDSKQFGIEDEELNRAVLNWVLDRLNDGPIPDWLFADLDKFKD